MDKNIKFILEKLPDEIREIYDICLKSGNNLTEIHIRANQNTYVQINGKNKDLTHEEYIQENNTCALAIRRRS